MKVDIWMPLYVSDYLSDTLCLTIEEHGIYFILMLHYWKRGKLTDNMEKLRLLTKLPVEKLPVLEGVLDEYFEHNATDCIYTNKRLEAELEKAKARRETASANGKKGGRPKNNPEKTNGLTGGFQSGKAKANPEKSSSPSPSPSPTIKKEYIEQAKGIIDYLNFKSNKNFKGGQKDLEKIATRLSTFSVEELKKVIDNKVAEWKNDDKMKTYLRPQTLFLNDERVDSYLNQTVASSQQQQTHNVLNGKVEYK